MINLRSIENIKKDHDFSKELLSIPAVDWATSQELEDYKTVLTQTAGKLEDIDKNIELTLNDQDENIRIAVSRSFRLDNTVSSVRELKFPPYLPQGKVQIQLGIIKVLTDVAKGKDSLGDEPQQKENDKKIQKVWKANPIIGSVIIDDKKNEMRLQESIDLFSKYLKECEYQFLKQRMNSKLETILDIYRRLIEDVEFYDEKKIEPKLMDVWKFSFKSYSRLSDIADTIYYRRATSFLVECRDCSDFLNKNENSKIYLMKKGDEKVFLEK
jgi:hypothetical protein